MGADEVTHFDGADIEAMLDTALRGDYADRARLLTFLATGRSTDAPGFDAMLDAIAARAGKGDEAALELLLETTHRLRLAEGAIRARITDDALAQDVAQQTLIAVEGHISSYGGLAHFRTWLYAVARNQALMTLRRHTPTAAAQPTTEGSARFTSILVNALTISDLIDRLPAPYAETLRLRLYDDLDYEAIAGRLNVPIGTVRSRLAKAKELLSVALTQPS